MRQKEQFSNHDDLSLRLGFDRKWQKNVLAEALTVNPKANAGPTRNYYQASGGLDYGSHRGGELGSSFEEGGEEMEEGVRGCMYGIKMTAMLLVGLLLLPFVVLALVLYGLIWWLPRRCCYMAGGIEDAVRQQNTGRRTTEQEEWEL